MAENMDGSLQSGDVFSSVTKIPNIADKGKEPIQAQSQSVRSTARKEPVDQSQCNSSAQSAGTLKRDKASSNVTLSVENGREILMCNFCQNVIHVGGEIASEDCLTILGEEETEMLLRKVKPRIAKEGEGSCKEPVGEEPFSERDKELVRIAKKALKEFIHGPNPIPKSK